jgi:hypothetical protein
MKAAYGISKKLLQALLREARQADVIIGGMELTSTYLAAWAGMISRRRVGGMGAYRSW